MFIRKKIIKGKTYFYLVKSVRDGQTIRQVFLEYLGAQAPSQKRLKALEKKHAKQ
jgi:hypothetical protein